MAPQPLVTCIVCAFNYGPYVERAVRSALEQKGLPDGALEVIVVDDGSTDDTPQLLAGFGDAITVIRQENRGPAVGTNRGIAMARGAFVSLLDADDEWLPDKLARQLELLERRPEVGLVHGDMDVIDGEGRRTRQSKYEWYGELPVVGRALGRLLAQNEATTSSITLRAEVAKAIPPAPAWAWCRDWWLAAHVAAAHEIDAIRDPVARYRIHGENVSAQDATSERAIGLWERDLRVRRLLLRDLDLSHATLDELAVAWARFAGFLQRVSQARALPQTHVVSVDDDDRRTAAALRGETERLLAVDPAAAGRAAAKAMAADPFDGASAELFEAARAQLSANEREPAETNVHGDVVIATRTRAMAPTPPPSQAQTDRLRELDALRAEITRARPDADPATVLERLRRFERARASIAATTALPAPVETQRTEAFAAVSAAVEASRSGSDARALARAAAALALDPADDHARAVLRRAIDALAGAAPHPSAQDTAMRTRFHAPAATALDGSRTFVALAFAHELTEDPTLLRTWAATFAPDADATLAIATADPDLAAVHGRLAAALTSAGIPADGDHDLALVLASPGGEPEAALARETHALLSSADASALRCLAGHPRAADDTLRALAERRWSHDGLGEPLSFAIKICPQRWDGAERWGDTHFARALADELERRGHRATIEVVAEWDDSQAPGHDADVVLHLRGLWPYVPRTDQLNVLWNISHPDLVTPAECNAYDLVATPSARHAGELASRTSTPVVVVEQATDPVSFFPQHDPAHARELVFVGNSRGIMRPILRDLLGGRDPGHDLAVWGQQWEQFLDPRLIAGEHLPNDAVRRAYTSAAIVLNDHWDDMRTQGIISNRVFDALACGALVVSDHLPELADRFGDAVVTYRTPDELHASVARLLADPAERAERAARGRAQTLAEHTFRHRVDALLQAIAAQRGPTPRPKPAARAVPVALQPPPALKDADPRPILCS